MGFSRFELLSSAQRKLRSRLLIKKKVNIVNPKILHNITQMISRYQEDIIYKKVFE